MANFNIAYKERCTTPSITSFTNTASDYTITWSTTNLIPGASYTIEKSLDGGIYEVITTVTASSGTYTGLLGTLGSTSTNFRLSTTSPNCGTLYSAAASYVTPNVFDCENIDEESSDHVPFSLASMFVDQTGAQQGNEATKASTRFTSLAVGKTFNFRSFSTITNSSGGFNVAYRKVVFQPDTGAPIEILTMQPTSNIQSSDMDSIDFTWTVPSTGVISVEIGIVGGWTGSNHSSGLSYSLDEHLRILEGNPADGLISACFNLTSSITVTIEKSSQQLP